MKAFSRKSLEIIWTIFLTVAVLFLFGIFLKGAVEPLAPVITVLIVLLGTLYTFNKWTTAIMSIGGLALYAASWPAVSTWGTWPGMAIWAIGVLLWFTAVYLTFSEYLTKVEAIATHTLR